MFILNEDQKLAIQKINKFLSDNKEDCFILKGSAGTGKTTLIKEILKLVDQQSKRAILLAPTGKAARIISQKTQKSAQTIHKQIYHFEQLQLVDEIEEEQSEQHPGARIFFETSKEEPNAHVFIIDEASMVGQLKNQSDLLVFGSGSLLDDLISYLRIKRLHTNEVRYQVIFVGDPAQLPPVGSTFSPCLSADFLKSQYRMDVVEFELKQVMRQKDHQFILENATALRNAIFDRKYDEFQLHTDQQEVFENSIDQATDMIAYAQNDDNILVTYSNEAAFKYNQIIRSKRWQQENIPLKQDELLIVSQNAPLYQLYNGDMIKVVDIHQTTIQRAIQLPVEKKGTVTVQLKFKLIRVIHMGLQQQLELMIFENFLESPNRSISPLEQRALLVDFLLRNPELKNQKKNSLFAKNLQKDPFFNALKVKYAYAITCHKAQGGEWPTTVVDFSNYQQQNEGFFRWAYTAITRAQSKLYLINPPCYFGSMTKLMTLLEAEKIDDDIQPTPLHLQEQKQSLKLNPPPNLKIDQISDFELQLQHPKLREYYAYLKYNLNQHQIEIKKILHQQYKEKYVLSLSNGDEFTAELYYKQNHKISNIQYSTHTKIDPNLQTVIQFYFDALKSIADQSLEQIFIDMPDFIKELRDYINLAILKSDISIISVEFQQYAIRFHFAKKLEIAKVDIFYNAKQQLTRINLVHPTPNQYLIYQELKNLLKNHKYLLLQTKTSFIEE
jgi:ABC-type oligopeptide transport system ATPase subunit